MSIASMSVEERRAYMRETQRRCRARKRQLRIINCANCGAVFETRCVNRRFCSPKCCKEFNNERKRKKEWHTLVCQICGKEFRQHNARQHYCSKECTHEAYKRWKKARYVPHPRQKKEKPATAKKPTQKPKNQGLGDLLEKRLTKRQGHPPKRESQLVIASKPRETTVAKSAKGGRPQLTPQQKRDRDERAAMAYVYGDFKTNDERRAAFAALTKEQKDMAKRIYEKRWSYAHFRFDY